MNTRRRLLFATAAALALVGSAARGQTWPERTLRIINPYAASGQCVHRSGTLAFCEAELTDTEGRAVARASATLRYLRGVPPDRP